MKLRNKILAMAVVAVAGVNVYLANDIQMPQNILSFLNLETIADAQEPGGRYEIGDDGNKYYYTNETDWVYQGQERTVNGRHEYFYKCQEFVSKGPVRCTKGATIWSPNPNL